VQLSDGYWKMYSIVIQLGAILCLPVYFRGRIAKFFSTFPRGERGERTALTHPLGLTTLAFVVTAVPSYFLTKVIGKNLESLYVMGGSLLVGGIVMWVVDAAKARWESAIDATGNPIRTRSMEEMSVGQAIWIGACQILSAVFPGTSRSMATIAAGQLAGMSRSAALEFSFFLSMPTMAVATVYTLLKSLRGKGENPIGVSQITSEQWLVILIGFVISFVVAYGSVAWFMAWVRRRGFAPFAVYRIVVGVLVLLWAAGVIGHSQQRGLPSRATPPKRPLMVKSNRAGNEELQGSLLLPRLANIKARAM
jgi:undecaprenyl-diphosphatase